MEDQSRNRIKELVAQQEQILGQINQNTTQRQQLEAAYQLDVGRHRRPIRVRTGCRGRGQWRGRGAGGEQSARFRAG